MPRNSLTCKVILTSCLLLFSSLPDALAGGRVVTWYLDGTRIEQELDVAGVAQEIGLPPSILPGSLRVRPVSGGRILRVEVVPVKPDRVAEKELARLDWHRDELQDRLRALEVKEEIFKATAKSQGSKAPRRTRTNPEPLSAIRQGTDFAIARLEDVYKAKRLTERELKVLERRQSALRKQENVSGSVARIWLAGKRGKVQVSYLTNGQGWQPSYDVRLLGGSAEVTLMASLPKVDKSLGGAVVPARLADGATVSPMPLGAGVPARVGSYLMPVVSDKQEPGLQTAKTVTLRNDTGLFMPPGEASGFWKEEFIGQLPFPGLKPGESCIMGFGISGGVTKEESKE